MVQLNARYAKNVFGKFSIFGKKIVFVFVFVFDIKAFDIKVFVISAFDIKVFEIKILRPFKQVQHQIVNNPNRELMSISKALK